MKNYLLSALVLGLMMTACSKEKTEQTGTTDSMYTEDMSTDTSAALPPSDTSAMNASSPGRTDTANMQRDSIATPQR